MDEMRNIKLVLEYDGTNYAGWQVQPNGPTVQEELEKAVQQVTGQPARITGAGRTDAGVHAVGQTANFHTGSDLPVERIAAALNYYLPDDIAVLSAEDAAAAFHARKDAVSKLYRYRMLVRQTRSPLRSGYALLVRDRLDLQAMRPCVEHLAGRLDFAAFASEGFRYRSTERRVLRSELVESGDELHFVIEADGFLYNMVRSLVGTLLEAGRGKLDLEDFKRLFTERDRSRAGRTAPPHGLCLVTVRYGEVR